MFFFQKKSYNCDVCSAPLERERNHSFDATWRGELNDGERLKLCTACLMRTYKKYLSSFTAKAIIVEPQLGMKNFRFNAYHFYTFEQMPQWNWPIESVHNLINMLPDDGACTTCSASHAPFFYCSPDIFHHDPYTMKINTSVAGEQLCPECAGRKIQDQILRLNLFLSEVLPPREGDGIAFSFES